jgi:hypothetical protein
MKISVFRLVKIELNNSKYNRSTFPEKDRYSHLVRIGQGWRPLFVWVNTGHVLFD